MKKRKSEFVGWMGPILDALRALGGSGKPQEVLDWIVERFDLSERLEETLRSGQTRFYNQVHWARQNLVWEGLLDGSTRGVWTLTQKGYETSLDEVSARDIFLKWVKIHAEARKNVEETGTTPDEDDHVDIITEDHKGVLLELLTKLTPENFERICARLLRESGFEKVTVTGGPKDEGIDGIGILQVNAFVSFKVLFQCKRYTNRAVTRSQVGDFRNAMIGRADKGIIITTGTFTADARQEADRAGAPPVELVDGEKLVEMFESVELGLKPRTVYEVDRAFFSSFLPKET
ncbi:MAG: restriction endonuclease [Candidatus Eisenbacteria bacterium]|uniref:Restriction endonuclease n=1 Tax=Eiseniibacteriota bacterium TaxID=2212470 RepID=A0A948W807_UNCEI|nr:restriction endonuclease [Candidatus Eisenbacteria bacterium]